MASMGQATAMEAMTATVVMALVVLCFRTS
jgi:hypothetical protein